MALPQDTSEISERARPFGGETAFALKIHMHIVLTPGQEAWLRAHVASGDFGSVEEAARRLIDERIAELSAAGPKRQREALLSARWATPISRRSPERKWRSVAAVSIMN